MKEVIVRSISGLLFIIIMVAALLGGVLWYSLLFGAIMVIMMLEYFRITIPKGALKWQKGASLAVAIALFAAVLLAGYGILEAKYLLIPALMPLLIFIDEHGRAKMDIALARGKKEFDKRQTLKEKEDRREMDRAIKRF